MSEVTVVAVLKAKPGNEAAVIAGLSDLAAQSHGEEGCIRYTIHRPADDPARIVMIERWRSRADLDVHFTKPYVAAVASSLDLLEDSPQIYFLDAVPAGDPVKGVL